ncbi:hypothetical protein BGX21_010073, partial [Mortierella sp. AD011]
MLVAGASTLLSIDNGNESSTSVPNPAIYYNLAVKQKAVYQPTFKCHRRLQEKKIVSLGVEESISNIESRLPLHRRDGTRFETYIKEFEQVLKQFDGFYNSDDMLVKKHQQGTPKARDVGFAIITDRLHMVEGSIGRQRHPSDKVAIGVGLGQFRSKPKLLQKFVHWATSSLELMNMTPPKSALYARNLQDKWKSKLSTAEL